MRAARPEPIIIIDAVYTRCAIQHDKSVAVNCLVLFMTNWNKVKMSWQTQPLCCDAASGLDTVHFHCSASKQAVRYLLVCCTRSLWNRNRAVCCHISCYIFHLPRSYSYLANLEKSSPIHTWSSGRLRWRELEDLYKHGSVTWMEMIPDQRFSIWFPNKVHRSQNKYAECRINSIFLRSNLPI